MDTLINAGNRQKEFGFLCRIVALEKQLQEARAQIECLTGQLSQSRIGNDNSTCMVAEFVQHLPLTSREREVALLFLEVANDKKLAPRLGVSVQTIRNHIGSIQRKLGINSREELVVFLLGRKTI